MAANTCITWENFVEIHNEQLQSIGLPPSLWQKLYSKLAPKVIRDAGNVFELFKGEDISGKKWSLHAKGNLGKNQDVFIVDHAWSSDGGARAKKKLDKAPELVLRLKHMMCLHEDVDEENTEYLDSSKVLQQLSGVSEEKAENFLSIAKHDLIDALNYAEGEESTPKMTNDEPEEMFLSYEEFKIGFEEATGPERKGDLSEEFIKKMYQKYTKDQEEQKSKVQYGFATTANYSWEESVEGDGTVSVLVSVPPSTKKTSISSKLACKHWSFGVKGCEPVIDGDFYAVVIPDECFWTIDCPGVIQMTLQKRDPAEGMWPTLIKGEKQFTGDEIYEQARDKEQERISNATSILGAMWYYNQTYQAVMVQGGPQEHVWYLMDEVGSAIIHSSTPNLKCSPFAYAVNGVMYSVVWPIEDINTGDVCTRNFCPALMGLETPKQKEARLMACYPEMPLECPRSFLEDFAETVCSMKKSSLKVIIAPLGIELSQELDSSQKMELSLKFYVDEGGKNVQPVLKNLGCTFSDKPDGATALWLSHSSSVITVDPQQKVNRLSGEDFLLRRDLLSRMIQKKLGQVPWFPVSYSLRSQLPALCADHYMRGLSSMWMIRSANQNEFSFRPVITSELRRVIRLVETGPLVASHFCISTALFKKKSLCLQYTVMVPSLNTMELHIHNTPRIRLAPNEFNPLKEIDEYDASALITEDDKKPQDSATLMEFIDQVDKHYLARSQKSWEEVQKVVFECIGELFHALKPSLSSGGSNNSLDKLCAVYGVDILIKEGTYPVIVGVNAVPSFANDEVMTEVIYLTFGEHTEKASLIASRNVTRVTFED